MRASGMPDVDLGALVHALINIIKGPASRVHFIQHRLRKPAASQVLSVQIGLVIAGSKGVARFPHHHIESLCNLEILRDEDQFTFTGLPIKVRERSDLARSPHSIYYQDRGNRHDRPDLLEPKMQTDGDNAWREKLIDISVPLQNDVPADPPGNHPHIRYSNHQQKSRR